MIRAGVQKGKKVFVIKTDGVTFVDKLVERRQRYYEFEVHGRIGTQSIRSLSYYRRR